MLGLGPNATTYGRSRAAVAMYRAMYFGYGDESGGRGLWERRRLAGARPREIESEQPSQQLLVAELSRRLLSPVGIEHRRIEGVVEVGEPGGALVVEVGERPAAQHSFGVLVDGVAGTGAARGSRGAPRGPARAG